jgi:hypothetical protein
MIGVHLSMFTARQAQTLYGWVPACVGSRKKKLDYLAILKFDNFLLFIRHINLYTNYKY